MAIKFKLKSHSAAYFTAIILMTAVFGVIAYNEFDFNNANAAKVADLASTIDISKPLSSKEFGIKRAQIALEEYGKNVHEETPNCNCGPEIDKYTEGNRAQWCTMFASWVTKEAGSPVDTGSRSATWRFINSQDFRQYLEDNGTWYSADEVRENRLEPQLGDFVIYWRGSEDGRLGHVDVVVSESGYGQADLIGGNINNKLTLRKGFRYVDNYGFLGFGRPEAY